jgi:hypothetical protein
MYLTNLIAFLEKYDPAQVVPVGFHRPHSYRGYYDQLAFEPKRPGRRVNAPRPGPEHNFRAEPGQSQYRRLCQKGQQQCHTTHRRLKPF